MKKYRIYIDEVGNNDLGSSYDPNHRYLSLTGVLFELEYVKNIFQPALESLKSKYFGFNNVFHNLFQQNRNKCCF